MTQLRTQLNFIFKRNVQLVFLVLLITLMVISGVVWANNKHLFTLSSEQPFTELYFTQPSKLPTFVAANANSTVQYELVSHEQQLAKYAVQISVTEGDHQYDQPIVITSLEPSQKQILTVNLQPHQSGQKILVVIALHNFATNTNQRIQFYTKS